MNNTYDIQNGHHKLTKYQTSNKLFIHCSKHVVRRPRSSSINLAIIKNITLNNAAASADSGRVAAADDVVEVEVEVGSLAAASAAEPFDEVAAIASFNIEE